MCNPTPMTDIDSKVTRLVPGWKLEYDPPAVQVQQILLQRYDQPLPDNGPKPIRSEDSSEIPDYAQLLCFLTVGITDEYPDWVIFSCTWTFLMLEAKFRYLVVGIQPDKFKDEYLSLRHNIKKFLERHLRTDFYQSLSPPERKANLISLMISRFQEDMGRFDRPDDDFKTYPTNYTVGKRMSARPGGKVLTLDDLEEALSRRWDGRLRSSKKDEEEEVEEVIEPSESLEDDEEEAREPPIPRRPKEAVFAPQTQPSYVKPTFPTPGKKRVFRIKAVQPDGASKSKRLPRMRHPIPQEAEEAESSDNGEDLDDEDDMDLLPDSEADSEDSDVESRSRWCYCGQ